MQAAAEFRHHMIDGQLEPNQVLSPAIVSAMGVVAREAFVPEAYQGAAYIDESIPLLEGRYMLSPLLLGQLLEALSPKAGEKILVVGAGSGYAAAVLHQLGCAVHMLEESPELATRARRVFNQQGLSAIEVHTGPLTMGWNSAKPYDKILIEGGVSVCIEDWRQQLGEAGVIAYVEIVDPMPLSHHGYGYVTAVTKQNDQMAKLRGANVASPILLTAEQKEGFRFA